MSQLGDQFSSDNSQSSYEFSEGSESGTDMEETMPMGSDEQPFVLVNNSYFQPDA